MAEAPVEEEEAIDGEPFDLAASTVLREGGADVDFTPFLFTFQDRSGESKTCSVIVVAFSKGKFLVAVPFEVWHRTVSKRLLPEGSLSRAVSLAVIASDPADRATIIPETEIKIWVGFASEALISELVGVEDSASDPDFVFVKGDTSCLPAASSLEEVAKTRFGVQLAEEEPIPPAVGARFEKLESDFSFIKSSLEQLATSLQRQGTMTGAGSSGFATAAEDIDDEFGLGAVSAPPGLALKPKSKPCPKPVAQRASSLGNQFDLDPTVVASALQAGVPVAQLKLFGELMKQKPKRLEDVPRKSQSAQNPLSESDGEQEQFADDMIAAGEQNLDPVSAALTQLTRIVSKLADNKKKEPTLEDLLEGAGSAGSSSIDGVTTFSSRKSAAALRALKKALVSSPKQIWQAIESHMEEDYHLRAAAPGLGQQQMTARGWAQYRSKIQNFPQSVRWSWATAGALDALRSGHVDECRARLCLMLAQADQQSIDRGSWLLCQEISLEPAPPYGTFQTHTLPDATEQQFSRLLDPRWVEAFVSAVKENDDHIERRRKLGSRAARREEEESTNRPAPKAKSKGKQSKDSGSGSGKGGNAAASNQGGD